MVADRAAGAGPRVCLIVDNPLRDLEGLVLVAWHLAQRGAEVFLVPMYGQGYEVLSLCPDAVVVNYARATNRFLLESYAEAGIFVSVLDTEGGVVDSLEDYATSLSRNGTLGLVDQMLMWGPKQFDAFATLSGLPEERLAVTGCPRFDFCGMPWRTALPAPEDAEGPLVLVNTNFSLVNPRFSGGIEEELEVALGAGFSGWDRSYVDRLAHDTLEAWQKVMVTVRELAERLPEVRFVVRPHPFENLDPYERELADIANVQVRLEGSVMSWIHPAAAVLHLNCGTAIEATLMGKPAINLEWLNTITLRQNAPLPHQISHPAASLDDLVSLLAEIPKTGGVTLPDDERKTNLQRVEEWFYTADGRAGERAADQILGALAQRTAAPSPEVCRRLALIGGKRQTPILGLVDGIGRLTLGPLHGWLRENVVTGGMSRAARRNKRFTPDQVREIARRIERAAGSSEHPLQVNSVKTRSRFNGLARDAVSLTRAGR